MTIRTKLYIFIRMRIINNWFPEVSDLLRSLVKAGFKLVSGNNGENEFKFVNKGQFVRELTACDESWLRVESPEGKRLGLFLVLGNSPGELVADYHCHPLLDKVTTEHYDKWEGSKQLTETVNY